MKNISIEELKLLQLNMLIKIDEFCRNHGIEYSLMYGTLLGAVRHGGYIPWDDDIDICMTRPNYQRFLELFNGSVEHLHVLAPEIEKSYYAPFANVYDDRTILYEKTENHNHHDIGIKIDVFPIDGVPDNYTKYSFFLKLIRLCNFVMAMKRRKLAKQNSIKVLLKVYITRIITCFLSYSSIQILLHKIVTRYNYSEATFVDVYLYALHCRAPKDYFENYSDIGFEGHSFRSVAAYDKVLKLLYGDYMKLPPEEERFPKHSFDAYWK